jgi:hypothetical protein
MEERDQRIEVGEEVTELGPTNRGCGRYRADMDWGGKQLEVLIHSGMEF